ncbi:MAG: HD domain-containing protein [Firmicutes bacterium]|nr:HD domain-containing protein [Bacillota bacterium]MBQ6088435.1 HD domain-containing protein [Bacillota bacterium]
MKQIFVKDLKKEMEVIDFFMVKSVAVKTGSTGKPYLDVVLGDNTGEINGKKWDVGTSDHLLKEKDIVKIIAVVTEFNSQLQLKIQRIRKAVPESNPDDIMDMGDFVKAAPENPEDMYDYIFRSCDSIKDEDYRKLCLRVLEDNREKLMYYPAASKNHHAELGGLLYHTKRMLMNGERVCQVYTNLNKDLVIAGVVLHDIQKIFEIDADTDGMASGYSFEGQMLGHIVMGVKYIDKLADETDLPYEKKIMMEHMVLSHHYEPEFGSPKKPLFPEAEVLHYLDILDARMYDMEEAVAHTEPGGFSDRIWTLDNRRIYNPTK